MDAGHEMRVASRHPETLKLLVEPEKTYRDNWRESAHSGDSGQRVDDGASTCTSRTAQSVVNTYWASDTSTVAADVATPLPLFAEH